MVCETVYVCLLAAGRQPPEEWSDIRPQGRPRKCCQVLLSKCARGESCLAQPVPGRQRPGSQVAHMSLSGCVSQSHGGLPAPVKPLRAAQRLQLDTLKESPSAWSAQVCGLHTCSLPFLPCKLMPILLSPKSSSRKPLGSPSAALSSHGSETLEARCPHLRGSLFSTVWWGGHLHPYLPTCAP